MALTKTPARIQPAFNEIVFIDDTNPTLTVTGVAPSPAYSITFSRVPQNDVRRFDIRALVSQLFVDRREVVAPVQSNNIGIWCYRDLSLVSKYSVAGSIFTAFNAVRQIGEPLDLYSSNSAVLTDTEPGANGTRVIPAYPGYPIGCTIGAVSRYEHPRDEAMAVTFTTTKAGEIVSITTYGAGVLDWGDGSVEEVDSGVSGVTRSHTFATADTHAVYLLPAADFGVNFYACKNLTSVDKWNGSIKTIGFRDCSTLTSIPAGPIFGTTLARGNDYYIDNFFNGTALVDVDGTVFQNWADKIASATGVFESSKIEILRAGTFSNMPRCSSFARVCNMCAELTTIEPGAFAGAFSCTSMQFAFQDAASLVAVADDVFSDMHALRNVGGTFAGCAAVENFAVSIFDSNLLLTTLTSCFEACISATSATPSTGGVRLWERTASAGFVVPTAFGGCFYYNINRLDYADIPTNWK